jgi:hypothetical protein
LSLIALLRSFTRHRFRWSSSSKHDAFLKYGKQASEQAKKYTLGTDPKENTTPLLSLPIRNRPRTDQKENAPPLPIRNIPRTDQKENAPATVA